MSLDAPRWQEKLDASDMRIGVVVSRFNESITQALLDGALRALREHGCEASRTDVVHVPGALEIGTIAAAMAHSQRYDAIVCLGCVIRGDTAHFDHVCQGAMQAIGQIAQRGDIGVGNGVLTVDTLEQARERIGGSHGHKGEEAAWTAIAVAQALRRLKAEK